ADHQGTEGHLDDRVGHAHGLQTHGGEQDDDRPAHHGRHGPGQDPADDHGDEEAGHDDRAAEQHAAAQLQDRAEDRGDLRETQHLGAHHGEEQHHGVLDDAQHGRGDGGALGEDLLPDQPAIDAGPLDDRTEQPGDEAGDQHIDPHQHDG